MFTKIFKRDRSSLSIAVLALLVNAFVYLSINVHNPTYLIDYKLNSNPDAVHFVELARNIYERHAFSRQTEPPFAPCGARQPGYPLVMGSFYKLFGTIGIYLLNVLCHVAMSVAVYSLCTPIFGAAISRLAGILIAADLMLAILNYTAMSEPLFCVFSTVGVLLWLRSMIEPKTGNTHELIVIGLMMGIATLVRPTSLYLPAVVLIAGGIIAISRKNFAAFYRSFVIFFIASCSITPWIARNYFVFNLPVISSTDASNLIYWCGASAHAIEREVTIAEAREDICEEFKLVSLVEANNHWIADRPLEVLYKQQKSAVHKVIWRYPKGLVKSSVIGCMKSSISHNVGSLANICGLNWHGPGLSKIIRGDFSSLTKMSESNSVILTVAFIWQLGLTFLVLTTGLLGIVIGLGHQKLRLPTLLLCIVAAYYYLTVAVVGSEAYFRHRAMIIPMWCIFASLAIGEYLKNHRK